MPNYKQYRRINYKSQRNKKTRILKDKYRTKTKTGIIIPQPEPKKT